MLSTVPWGVVRSALHVGRREGDAVWHRRSDRRIPPHETVVKRSVINSVINVSVSRDIRTSPAHRPWPARKSQGRELRADAVKVRRPRASGVGAKRRTLDGVEHSSTLTNVPAAPACRPRRSGGRPGAETRCERGWDPPAECARDRTPDPGSAGGAYSPPIVTPHRSDTDRQVVA